MTLLVLLVIHRDEIMKLFILSLTALTLNHWSTLLLDLC